MPAGLSSTSSPGVPAAKRSIRSRTSADQAARPAAAGPVRKPQLEAVRARHGEARAIEMAFEIGDRAAADDRRRPSSRWRRRVEQRRESGGHADRVGRVGELDERAVEVEEKRGIVEQAKGGAAKSFRRRRRPRSGRSGYNLFFPRHRTGTSPLALADPPDHAGGGTIGNPRSGIGFRVQRPRRVAGDERGARVAEQMYQHPAGGAVRIRTRRQLG